MSVTVVGIRQSDLKSGQEIKERGLRTIFPYWLKRRSDRIKRCNGNGE